MTRTYQEILDSYSKYNKGATATAIGLQSGLAIGQVLAGQKIKEQFTYTPPDKIRASLVDLSTPDIYTPAMRNLDKAFIGNIKAQREAGRVVGGDSLFAYSEGERRISEAQTQEYRKTRNQEELTNAQLQAQADQINLGVDATTAKMDADIGTMKAAQDSKTFDSVASMISNIGNISANSVANELNAELGLKQLTDFDVQNAQKKVAAQNKVDTERSIKELDEFEKELDTSIFDQLEDIDIADSQNAFVGNTYDFTDITGNTGLYGNSLKKGFQPPGNTKVLPGRNVFQSTLSIAYNTPTGNINVPTKHTGNLEQGFAGMSIYNPDFRGRLQDVYDKTAPAESYNFKYFNATPNKRKIF